MSFWSRIGLADFDTVQSLHQELQELREENSRLIAENSEKLKDQLLLGIKSEITEQRKAQYAAYEHLLDNEINNLRNNLSKLVLKTSRCFSDCEQERFVALQNGIMETSDSIYKIWEAIKLVWINDLLDEIEP